MPHQKRRIAKKKTFTGCWSCREASVKCDCTRPACLRCIQSRKACKGYDVSLTWVDATSTRQPPTAIKRQAMSIAPVIYPEVLDAWNIDATLARLEICEPESHDSDTTFAGPFGVFHMSSKAPGDDVAQIGEDGTAPEDLGASIYMAAVEQPSAVTAPSRSVLDSSQTCHRHAAACTSDLADGTLCHSSRAEASEPLAVPSEALQTTVACLPSTIPRPLAQGNPWAQLLLHHYTEHIATLLQPVARLNNTYKSIHAPVALRALDALCKIAGNTHSSVAASSIAVLFSLLATSAVHLRSEKGIVSKDLFHRLRHESYSNLSLALEDSSSLAPAADPVREEATLHNLENIMSASLTLVTLDVSDIA